MGSRKLEIKEFSSLEEIKGKLGLSKVNDKLMHSVLENDKKKIDEGKTLKEAINYGISTFNPDLMFENLVNSYSQAEKLYGEKLLRQLTGYDPRYLERNIVIPEFKRELKKRIEENIEGMKKDGMLNDEGEIIEKGVQMATLIMYIEELDEITPKGEFGEIVHKKASVYGEKGDIRNFRKGDRYRDIAIKKSVKRAVRRGHKKLINEDMQTFEREHKGRTYIVYGMDASGSMKGKKIEQSKKAGIALAYKAIEHKDMVGLISFGTKIKQKVECTDDFGLLLKEMVRINASMETNFTSMIENSIDMFPEGNMTKHLVILSDALPTVGAKPVEETLQAVSAARGKGITTSLIGISLDEKGEETAKKIVEIGQGKLYVVKDLEQLDKIILEDYYSVM
ncbi:VWA domain-containing protein [Candidatus Woesearchaeota archaeon]|nr:VWA domain-containing protein [Candidatus Woesearchaeota archaeon]